MKRPIIAVAIGFLFTADSSAQVGFGIKGGINFATPGGADVASIVKSRTGFAAGGYLEVSLPLLLTIQPEILYTTKGFKMEQNVTQLGQTYSSNSTNTYSYLEIPVLVKYSLPVPIVKPSLYVGPEVGFLLSAKNTYQATGIPSTDDDIKSSITNTDFGAVFGASAHLLVADFDVRYTFGLKTTDNSNRAKLYNRVWSIMTAIPLF